MGMTRRGSIVLEGELIFALGTIEIQFPLLSDWKVRGATNELESALTNKRFWRENGDANLKEMSTKSARTYL
jgi:hypothetical protein